jgi:hypothetical protein
MKAIKKIFALSLLVFSQSVVYANCNAVITNNSNKPWGVTFNTIRGKVYFPESNCSTLTGTCWVQPHSQLNIEYTHNTGFAAGALHLRDAQSEQHTLAYAAKNSECPRLESKGNVEGVSLNDPSRGSFVIMNDGWLA